VTPATAETTLDPAPTAAGHHPRIAVAVIVAVGVATVVAIVAGEGRPALAVLPVVAAAVLWAVSRMPLRYPAAALVLLSLSLDNSADADLGLWKTPLAFVGDILRDNLERSLGLPGVKLSGLEVAVLGLLVLSLWRKATGNPLEARDRGGVQCPLIRDVVLIYVVALGYAVANGILRGGSFQIWQVRILLQIPFLFFFFQLAFPRREDSVLVGQVVVISAILKALLSIYIGRTVRRPDGTHLIFTTNHGDSILFVVAVLILLATEIERPGKARLGRTLGVVGLIAWGMVENNRRLGWVQLVLALAAVYALTTWRPWKRMVAQAAVAAVPVIMLYTAAGWGSQSAVFAGARMLRSLVDQKSDASTYWRAVENWNIAATMRDTPILGMGLGREYVEYMQNDDISSIYPEFKFWPHNSVLGLLLFGGVFGFAGMWVFYAAVIFLAIRAYPRSAHHADRVAAICAIVTVLVCMLQAYGDIGAPFTQYRVFAALALSVTGRLAMETGAWGGTAGGGSAGGGRTGVLSRLGVAR
jgi:hypothetical protein